MGGHTAGQTARSPAVAALSRRVRAAQLLAQLAAAAGAGCGPVARRAAAVPKPRSQFALVGCACVECAASARRRSNFD